MVKICINEHYKSLLMTKKNLLGKIKIAFWKFLRTICISEKGIQFGNTLIAQLTSWFA